MMDWRVLVRRLRPDRRDEAQADAVPAETAVSVCCTRTEEEFIRLGGLLGQLAETSSASLATVDQLLRWSQGRLDLDSSVCARDSLQQALSALREHGAACECVLKQINAAAQRIVRVIRQQELVAREASALLYGALMMRLEALAIDRSDQSAMLDLIERLFTLESRLRSFCAEQADDVESMAGTVRRASEPTREIIVALDRRSSAIQNFLDSLNATPPGLSELHDIAGAAREAWPGAFTRAVVALQCHDSVRQRLEHVAKAIDTESGNRLFYDVQLRQTEQALADLRAAEDAVRRELTELAGQAAGVSDAAGTAQQSLGSAARSDFTDLVDHARCAERLLESAARLTETLLTRFEPLENAFERFRSGLAEIGFDLHLVALNAQILAAHVSIPGRAMDVAADWAASSCHNALATARTLVEDLDSVLRLTSTLAGALHERREALALSASSLSGHIAALPGQMRTARERLTGTVDSLRESACLLRKDVEVAVERLSFADDAENSLASLLAYLAGRRQAAPDAGGEEAALANAMEGYTMHREREIHEGAAGLATEEPGAAPAAACDDGDNVELF